MSKKAKHVSLEPSETQGLMLQLMQRNCELNLEAQSHLEAEQRFYESQIQLYRLALYTAEATKGYVGQELARLQGEGRQLLQALVSIGEQVKEENGWSDDTKWDPVALTFTAPAQDFTASAAAEGSKAKITIQ